MKIRLRQFRTLIAEAMKGPDDADDLALLIQRHAGSYELVLYRPVGMKAEIIKSPKSTGFADHVIASMEANPGDSGYYEVGAVAAMPGWGPFVYDKTMFDLDGLAPDRFSVSPAARKIWTYYHDKRPDVSSTELTDCRLHHDEVLDCAYTLDTDGPNTTKMEARHNGLMSDPELLKVAERSSLERIIVRAGVRFFIRRRASK